MVAHTSRKSAVKEIATILCIFCGMGDNWSGGLDQTPPRTHIEVLDDRTT